MKKPSLFNRLTSALVAKAMTNAQGPQIMPGAMGKLLADMGLKEIGPHRYEHHVLVPMYRKCPKLTTFETPYGPAAIPTKQAKARLDGLKRERSGRFAGPFPTYGKKARLAMEGARD